MEFLNHELNSQRAGLYYFPAKSPRSTASLNFSLATLISLAIYPNSSFDETRTSFVKSPFAK